MMTLTFVVADEDENMGCLTSNSLYSTDTQWSLVDDMKCCTALARVL